MRRSLRGPVRRYAALCNIFRSPWRMRPLLTLTTIRLGHDSLLYTGAQFFLSETWAAAYYWLLRSSGRSDHLRTHIGSIEQVKSAIDLAHTRRANPLHDNALPDAALSLLQLLLLQVCAKPTELVEDSTDSADRRRAPGA